MYMVHGSKKGMRFEQLFEALNDKALNLIELLESMEFEVSVLELAHIHSYEDYGYECLAQYAASQEFVTTYH